MAILDALWDSEVELIDTVDPVRPCIGARQGLRIISGRTCVIGGVEVCVCICWAASFDAVDHIPTLRILDLGLIGFLCIVSVSSGGSLRLLSRANEHSRTGRSAATYISDAHLTRSAPMNRGIQAIAVVPSKKL